MSQTALALLKDGCQVMHGAAGRTACVPRSSRHVAITYDTIYRVFLTLVQQTSEMQASLQL